MSKKYKNSDFERAIVGSGGVISTIAKRMGCNWSTARKRIYESPRLLSLYNDERETILDMAESTIFNNIKNGDTQDAKWLLSRLGKNRGYAERREITGSDGNPAIKEIQIVYAEPDAS